MIALPLGLGTRLKRWPLVTLLVAAAWVAVHVSDRSDTRIVKQLLGAVAATGVRDAARELFVEYCQARKGDTKSCRKYAVLVWTGFPGKGKSEGPAVSEQLAAKKLRKELKRCGESKTCFAYKDIVWSFFNATRDDPGPIAGLKVYGRYQAAIEGYKTRLSGLCRVEHCLVTSNINPTSLALSQVRHGGLFHLMSNLVMLLVFGIYVEQRTSRAAYLLALMVGGTVGMAAHTALFSTGESLALGGSANVSAAMGLFFVFFFHQSMTFRVWLPRQLYSGTSFRAPVKYCFPLVFILSDVIGGLDSGFSDLAAGRVAYFAHIFGFAFGVLAALAITWWRRLPAPFIYETEVSDMMRLERSRDLREVLDLASDMARYNPENVHALEVGCGAFLKWSHVAKPNERASLFDYGRSFLMEHLSTVCAINAKKGELRYACKLLSQVPFFMPYRIVLARLGQVNLLRLADYALIEGHPMLAIRLYDCFLTRFPLSRKCDAVVETASDAIASLRLDSETTRALRAFHDHHPESQLAARIALEGRIA